MHLASGFGLYFDRKFITTTLYGVFLIFHVCLESNRYCPIEKLLSDKQCISR